MRLVCIEAIAQMGMVGFCFLLKPMPYHIIMYRIQISPSLANISTTILLELPISVIEWADLTRLQPSRNAVEVESVLEQ